MDVTILKKKAIVRLILETVIENYQNHLALAMLNVSPVRAFTGKISIVAII